MGKIFEAVTARGHPRITAGHPTTLMITRDGEVGPKGDCIIGVDASKGAAGLNEKLKSVIRLGGAVSIRIEAGGEVVRIHAHGHPLLTFTDPRDLVVRKSEFVCGRTLAIGADKAAADLPRKFVAKLQDPTNEIRISIGTQP